MPETILIFGFGYTARAVARLLIERGWAVIGTTRDPRRFHTISEAGVRPIDFRDAKAVHHAASTSKAILTTSGTEGRVCPTFSRYGDLISMSSPTWVGYLSANGVYGDYGGAWVDEESECRSTTERGLARINAERQWQSIANTSVIFRLPGIYGPGRSAIEAVRAGTARRIVKPGQVFSRAHVDDIAAAVVASLTSPSVGRVFNVADDEPAPPQEVVEYACRILGVDPPPPEPFETAQLSPMAASFYLDNKRVRNDRMKRELGVVLKYPTYREGLQGILYAETSQ